MLLELPLQPKPVQVSQELVETAHRAANGPLFWVLSKAAVDGNKQVLTILLSSPAVKNNQETLKTGVLETKVAAPHRLASKGRPDPVIKRLQKLIGP